MFPSRLLIAFLIPLIILGLGIWFTVNAEINRGSVRVAGALVGKADVELTVKDCRLEEEGTRTLVVAAEALNRDSADVSLDPNLFQAVVAPSSSPLGDALQHYIYHPMRFQSRCPQAPESHSRIPPGAVRSFTLYFWAENLPRGEEWKDYYLSLEYYDPAQSLMFSKLLQP
ncbi:MAG: hypothetical protein H5T72_04425 [Actinobacteria bacterium]|nr:hypothetical protein [Actinomycetota bacterium]